MSEIREVLGTETFGHTENAPGCTGNYRVPFDILWLNGYRGGFERRGPDTEQGMRYGSMFRNRRVQSHYLSVPFHPYGLPESKPSANPLRTLFYSGVTRVPTTRLPCKTRHLKESHLGRKERGRKGSNKNRIKCWSDSRRKGWTYETSLYTKPNTWWSVTGVPVLDTEYREKGSSRLIYGQLIELNHIVCI